MDYIPVIVLGVFVIIIYFVLNAKINKVSKSPVSSSIDNEGNKVLKNAKGETLLKL